MMEGRVFEIQRMSTEDGPGLRTTVFLKGCSLECIWCHNPESIKPGTEVLWYGVRCIGCRLCAAACPTGALAVSNKEILIDRKLCTGCGSCADICPSGALEKTGEIREAEELVSELLKDRVYFEKSGGGVTVSGGEPALQGEFTGEMLSMLKDAGVHTALDTCGMVKSEALSKLIPQTDLLLFDLKTADPREHRDFTGSDNGKIIENLKLACCLDTPIWIRTPIIPGYTGTEENIKALGALILEADLPARTKGIMKWELLAFNNLCADKYRRLGRKWHFEGTEVPQEKDMVRFANIAAEALSGAKKKIEVVWNGSVRKGE